MSKYFKDTEFRCRCGCGGNFISPRLVEMLDNARERAGVPFAVTSGYRCPEHNAKVGGVPDSAHLAGLAVDIATPDGAARYHIIKGLLGAGFTRIGINLDKNFIHADIDQAKPQGVIFKY